MSDPKLAALIQEATNVIAQVVENDRLIPMFARLSASILAAFMEHGFTREEAMSLLGAAAGRVKLS